MPGCGTQVQSCVAVVGPLHGNQSHPPRTGSPLRFCDTVFAVRAFRSQVFLLLRPFRRKLFPRAASSVGDTPDSLSPSRAQRKWYMPLVMLDWQRFSVTKTEKTFTGTRFLGATVGVRLDPLGANRTATARVSLFQNPKIQSGARLHAPSEPMLEYPPRGFSSCATKWWSEASGAERNTGISYAGRGVG